MRNALVYTMVCMTQTIIAYIIAYSGDKAVEYLTRGADDIWSTEKILTVAAGSMLAVYSVKLAYEYYQEQQEGGDDGAAKPEEVELKDKPTYDAVPNAAPDGSSSKESRGLQEDIEQGLDTGSTTR